MPHTFTPPPVPSDQSTTLGRVREDNREHDRALQLELFKLVTYVNTIPLTVPDGDKGDITGSDNTSNHYMRIVLVGVRELAEAHAVGADTPFNLTCTLSLDVGDAVELQFLHNVAESPWINQEIVSPDTLPGWFAITKLGT